MALNIKNKEAHRIAQELAEATGRSITQVVTDALREAHEKKRNQESVDVEALVTELNSIADHYSQLPLLDKRPAEEILGYDEQGLPGRWS